MEYSTSKNVRLQLDIVKYSPGDQVSMFDLLIISKQTLHNLGVVLDFKETTMQIDEILLPHEEHRLSATQTYHYQGA